MTVTLFEFSSWSHVTRDEHVVEKGQYMGMEDKLHIRRQRDSRIP
jgi:hypothetical protein